MPSLDELRYFVAAAKTGNMTRAAALMNLSQPALSHAIKRLETEIAVELFYREKSGVQLTRAGERFLLEARDLIGKWENVVNKLHDENLLIGGNVRFGCHSSVGIYTLPHFLKGLLANHPRLEFSFKHGLSREIANEVIEWKLDLALTINPPPHPDLVVVELAKDEIALWSRKDHFISDALILDPSLFQTQAILKSLGKKNAAFKRYIESSSLELIQTLTADGCGVGILPTRMALAASKKLQLYSESAPVFKDRLCLIYRGGKQSATSRAIIDSIKQIRF